MTFDAPQPLLYQLRKNVKHGILSPFLYFHFRNKKKINKTHSLYTHSHLYVLIHTCVSHSDTHSVLQWCMRQDTN